MAGQISEFDEHVAGKFGYALTGKSCPDLRGSASSIFWIWSGKPSCRCAGEEKTRQDWSISADREDV